MKKILVFVLIISLAIVLAGCRAEKNKNDIFNLIEENYDAILKACEEKDADALSAIDGIAEVKIVQGYVLVYCKGVGIAPSSQDYGFYYSEENLPVTVDCTLSINGYTADLTPKGEGYEYTEDHNVFYTEHIKSNIYFYSNAY